MIIGLFSGKESMIHRKLNSFLTLALLALAAMACKKDDETESYPSLSGNLYFDCPAYVAPEQVVTLTPKGISHPDGGEVSYYWKISPSMPESDTVDVFTRAFSDTLGRYTVLCYAFASGYTGDSYQVSVDVVKGGLDGSISNTGIKDTDLRVYWEGDDYFYVRHGSLDWFRNNLSSPLSGTPYINLDVTSDVFGRYYSYEEAMKACPEGWRLPSEDDWLSLAEELGSEVAGKYAPIKDITSKILANAYYNDVLMTDYWPEVGVLDNDSKLALIPVGYSNLGEPASDGTYPAASFFGMSNYSVVWTSDKVEGDDSMAYYRYLVYNQPDMFVGKGDVNSFGASVRCVRDVEQSE